MRKLFLLIALLFLSSPAWAATTYYATTSAGGGNWNAATTWSTVSSSSATNTGTYPVAGDTAVLDSGFTNTVTVNVTSACATLTLTGSGGTLAFGNFYITTTAGASFGGTITAGTGGINLSGTQTLTTNAITFPGNMTYAILTIVGDLTVSGMLSNYNSAINSISGAYNVTCSTLQENYTTTFYSGQTVTVTSAINLYGSSFLIKSSTASSPAYLNYAGALTNENISQVKFTDIDASGSGHALYNYHGGALTRTSNILNRTADDFVSSTGGGLWIQ